MPLVVLTADRPPELRGIGAGQTIDQIKLYGSAVRWFCEVGTHGADDEGLLHLAHGRLPGRRRRDRSAAGAGPPQPALARAARPRRRRGSGDRKRSAGARGPRRAAADRGTATTRAHGLALDEVAGHIAAAISGVIVAGRQTDPALREPLARLAAATGFPILAEPTSQLRCGAHDRSGVIAAYDLLLRDEEFAAAVVLTSSSASERCRQASRCGPGSPLRGPSR